MLIEAGESFVGEVSLSCSRIADFAILGRSQSSGASSEPTRRGSLMRQSSFAHGNLLEQYHSVVEAMRTLGYNSSDILTTWKIVGAILEAGNIEFETVETQEGDVANVANMVSCTIAAELLGVAPHGLATLLTKRTMTTGGEKITKALTITESTKARNAFVKALYANLFSKIVSAVNVSLAGLGHGSSTSINKAAFTSIGILDIFGFESFHRNEFEQLLINFANESLQNTFNEQIFQNELRMYKEENVKVRYMPFLCCFYKKLS
jgi:myosin heavy subunit